MPEGHTIHRLAEDLQRDFSGQTLAVSSPQGPFAAGATVLDGRRLINVDAYGKHLLYRWHRAFLHVHLGLYGSIRTCTSPPPNPRGHVRLRVCGERKTFDLSKPSKCELLSALQVDRLLRHLGPDPLRNDADPEQAWNRIRRSPKAIGAILLDQSVIAGIGNIYRCEILFLQGIHPERPGDTLTREEFDEMWQRTVSLLRIGKQHNQIITTEISRQGKLSGRLNPSDRVQVYRRSCCLICRSAITSWKLADRTVYACPQCQTR